MPGFLRRLCPIWVTNIVAGKTNCGTFYAAPDYLAVGSDEDYFFTPLTPVTAQRIADRLGCTLPTRKMANDIYTAAAVKLAPSPIPPTPQMVTVPIFAQHNAVVRTQRLAQLPTHPLGALVAGDKKDIVITARLTDSPGKVAIYGWHQTNGVAIQPLYLGHTAAWVDYSHGFRLVQERMLVNGAPTTVAAVLADPNLAGLLSDEGVVSAPRYFPLTPTLSPSEGERGRIAPLAGFAPSSQFDEQTLSFAFEPEVKIHINAPATTFVEPDKPVWLIFYALPNGNTTEQTIGHQLKAGDDWHFNIQHIGAQTRFLRDRIKDRIIVVAYLEAAMKSWPAWRKQHGDEQIPAILDAVRQKLPARRVERILTGHSGGGSLTFGYLNVVKEIPDDLTRIAFLDSDYAYNTTNHLAKLVRWLKASPQHHLCVLAYNDAVALLDGKPFVSAAGGTWGRSHAMLRDLGAPFPFSSRTRDGLEVAAALDDRIEFLLKENPERKILHTVQVERNGFIHAMVSGTTNAGQGYEYFGERAYEKWIAE